MACRSVLSWGRFNLGVVIIHKTLLGVEVLIFVTFGDLVKYFVDVVVSHVILLYIAKGPLQSGFKSSNEMF